MSFGGNAAVEHELLPRNCSNGLDFVAWMSVAEVEAGLFNDNNDVEKVALLLSGNAEGRSPEFVVEVASIDLTGSVSFVGVLVSVVLDRGLSFVFAKCGFDACPAVARALVRRAFCEK